MLSACLRSRPQQSWVPHADLTDFGAHSLLGKCSKVPNCYFRICKHMLMVLLILIHLML